VQAAAFIALAGIAGCYESHRVTGPRPDAGPVDAGRRLDAGAPSCLPASSRGELLYSSATSRVYRHCDGRSLLYERVGRSAELSMADVTRLRRDHPIFGMSGISGVGTGLCCLSSGTAGGHCIVVFRDDDLSPAALAAWLDVVFADEDDSCFGVVVEAEVVIAPG